MTSSPTIPSPSFADPRNPVARLLAVAEAHSSRLALHNDELNVSYEQFVQRVFALGSVFNERCSGGRLLLSLRKSLDAYAAPFAAMLAGAVYCPVNRDLPNARRASIVKAFAPDLIFTDHPAEWDALTSRASILGPEEVTAESLLLSDAELVVDQRPVYVIFTSGSSGEPKGVVIPMTGLCHYLDWAIPALELGPGSRCSQHPNLGFDLSVLDVFGSLCSGATLVPLSSVTDRMFPARAIQRHAIDTWVSVPSVIDAMARAGDLNTDRLSTVRLMVFCGEPLRRPQCLEIFRNTESCRVINTYGPTEATVSCTALEVTSQNLSNVSGESVAIGEPIGGMTFEVDGIDEGELILIGPQVALGYWNNVQESERVFDRAAMSYRTGDWVRIERGQLFVTGRIDRQVKIRGHRIELGEIETLARELLSGRAVAVLVRDEAIILVVEGLVADSQQLSHDLAEALPSYMLPTELVCVSELPRTANDKIDYRSLENHHAK